MKRKSSKRKTWSKKSPTSLRWAHETTTGCLPDAPTWTIVSPDAVRRDPESLGYRDILVMVGATMLGCILADVLVSVWCLLW